MKRPLFLSGLLILACCLFGTPRTPINSSFTIDFPTAGSDDLFAILANPAAMSFGNATGFSYLTTYDQDDFDRSYSLLFTGENLGYAYERTEGRSYHRLALSSPIARNVYLGANWDWGRGSFGEGDYGVSALLRPSDWLSLASVNQFCNDHDQNRYQLGMGLRPIPVAGHPWSRVTLNGDIAYFRSDEDWHKPALGIDTEFLDGVRLGGTYDFESETVGLHFSLSAVHQRTGTIMRMDENDDLDRGLLFVHLSPKPFRTPRIEPKDNNWVKMNIRPQLVDKPSGTKIGPIVLMNGNQSSLAKVLDQINQLKKDPRVDGILFSNINVQMSFAHACELRDALLEFKKTGKKIVFYYDSIGNLNYALAASVADRIYLNPMGGIDLKGFSASQPYLRTLLDTLGIEVNNFRSHPYKTAGNMFSEKEMPAKEREALEYVLDGFYTEYRNMIASGRGDRLTKPVDEIIDNGPYSIGEDAFRLGLVDGLYYEDEITGLLTEKGVKAHYITLESADIQRRDWSDSPKTRIAVIYASGNIHMGESLPGKSIGSKTYAEAIRKARLDPSVRGIVLRVDSGGGSALASDIITREIRLCKEGKDPKPVYVSMGGVAGSGGYYIACYADKIFADPTTITGSIGVIGITFNIQELLDKVHVKFSTVKKGDHGDFGSLYRKMTDDEMELVSNSIEHTYNTFVDHVATGRGMNRDTVDGIAQGRIWTGTQARDRGLVDEIGGFAIALESMRKKLDANELELVEYPASKGFRVNANLTFGGIDTRMPAEWREFTESLSDLSQYRNEKALYLMPALWGLPTQ